jgi:predicted aldo/keto reductase-like oxidoreductase
MQRQGKSLESNKKARKTMEYRQLGKTSLVVSGLGLGTEHIGESRENIECILHLAVDAGINYIDLFFWDQLGSILNHYRNHFILAAHWEGLENILANISNGYVEIGMLTMIDTETKWSGQAQESLEQLRRYKEQGRIGYIGISSHRVPIAIKAVNSGLIDVLMYPVNLTSYAIEADRTLYQACADQGVGLVAMKPYAGGTLFVTAGRPSGITPVQCLAYTLSLPVSTAVTGVKNADELQAALYYWEAADEEKDCRSVIANIRHHLGDRNIYLGQCVYCNHCLPCPQNIAIGEIIRIVNLVEATDIEEALAEYAGLQVKASDCTECGVCVEQCPFDVDVMAKLRRAVELFESSNDGQDG